MSEEDIRGERIKKLGILKAAGMDPYPVSIGKDYSIDEVLARFPALETDAAIFSIVGRVMARRGQGGIVFIDLFDGSTGLTAHSTSSGQAGGTGRMQAVLQKDDMDADLFALFVDAVDIGDFIQVTGTPFTTKRGERSIKVSTWMMAAKSLLPIPDEWFGLKDEEKILRERYLDILLNADVRAMFERRTKFFQAIRDFLIERGYIEVDTPILDTSPGGADARPFATHHNALDIDIFLRIAPELWLKRLLIAGFPKVFEIGRVFRNEGQSREHAQDYTAIEFYQAFSDFREGMLLIQEMYRYVAKEVYGQYSFTINDFTVDLADEWKEIDYSTILREKFGIDPITCTEEEAIQVAREAGVLGSEEPNKARAIDHLWKSIRKTIAGPAFLTGVPIYLEPLAKRSTENPNVVERFQVIIAGSENGKGFSELNDPLDQRSRFEYQQKMRDAGDDEAQRMDEGYIRAMEYGMPPAFGFGVSERLFSFFENKPILEAQLFPLLRPKE